MTDGLWVIEEGEGPIVGTAIHAGHQVRRDIEEHLKLDDSQRLREEDPYTAAAIAGLPTRIRVKRSRFEFDLNRNSVNAIYETPDQAWGLEVWDEEGLDHEARQHSLNIHERYYAMLGSLLERIEHEYGDFVVLDVHSYNHRRQGPHAPPAPAKNAPEINIGTFSMDRQRWMHVVDPFIECLGQQQFRGRRLDVRENVAFQGRGAQTQFVHERFTRHGCAIAIEFKKFYMDEWTGVPDIEDLLAMKHLLDGTIDVLQEALAR